MSIFGNRLWMSTSLAIAALTLTVCGSGEKGGGTKGGPTVPVDAVPTPAAAPTPDPPLSASCERLPLGSSKYTCRAESPTFLGDVSDAIDQLQQDHPEYFSGDTVRNIGAYYVGMIRLLDKKNLCAAFDGEELAVKNTNDYNDQYKILTSWGQVRKGYIGTCYPAVFPLARSTPAPSPPGCRLPPSSEITCGKADPQYLGDVAGAIDQVLAQKPELFDLSQMAPGTDWPAVKDMLAYHGAVIEVLSKEGYCGRFDGEEIQIKQSNAFTEHYDINYADQYVRRGPGMFRISCYPAAF